MPFFRQIDLLGEGRLSVWKVTEEHFPVVLTENSQKRLAGMKRKDHRQGFLAVRMLLERAGLTDHDLRYDPSGKPFLEDGRSVSIAHSHAFAALYIGKQAWGVDVEKIHPAIVEKQTFIIGGEVLPEGCEAEALTLIWTVKEAIFKLSDTRPLNFVKDLHVYYYNVHESTGRARSVFPGWEKDFIFRFERMEDYLVTWCRIADEYIPAKK